MLETSSSGPSGVSGNVTIATGTSTAGRSGAVGANGRGSQRSGR